MDYTVSGDLAPTGSRSRTLLEPMLAATGFEIVTADYARRLYGAYTCVRRAA